MLGNKQTFIGAGQTNILSRLNAHSWPCVVSLKGLECYASHVGKADVAIYKLINNRNMCWQQAKHTSVSTNIINIYSISPATLTSSFAALPFTNNVHAISTTPTSQQTVFAVLARPQTKPGQAPARSISLPLKASLRLVRGNPGVKTRLLGNPQCAVVASEYQLIYPLIFPAIDDFFAIK